MTEKANTGTSDENKCVKGSECQEVVNNETGQIEVREKLEVVEVSSKTVDSKVVGEIENVYQESDSDNHSDTSADESESEQISHSRTLTDSEKEDTALNECRKKLPK